MVDGEKTGGAREPVVLVHGLWLSGWSLVALAARLGKDFAVARYSYPSRALGLRAQGERLAEFAEQLPGAAVHFVGHSLGGLVIRAMLHHRPPSRPGRVVTLGSPHGGSRAASRLAETDWGRSLLGRNIADLLAGVPRDFDSAGHPIGVIRGSRAIGLGRILARLDKPNDGVVTEQEAALPGAADALTLRVNHFGMLLSSTVAMQTSAFLRNGRFKR